MEAHASANEAPATDLHALRAAKPRCNSMRNNFKFGEVDEAADAECHLRCGDLNGERHCEPRDGVKGEIAR